MVHDPNDAKEVRQAQSREKRREEAKAETLRAVMETEEGRTVLRGVIGLTDMLSSGYVMGGHEAERHQTYLAGRKSIGIDLMAEIDRHCPELGELMLREGHAAEKREREEDEAAELDREGDEQEQDNG